MQLYAESLEQQCLEKDNKADIIKKQNKMVDDLKIDNGNLNN